MRGWSDEQTRQVSGGDPGAGGAHGVRASQGIPSEWAAIKSIAEKLGVHHESVRIWVRRAQVDAGERAGLTSEERERLRQLEREVRELRRANEILKSASVFFATELDGRRPK